MIFLSEPNTGPISPRESRLGFSLFNIHMYALDYLHFYNLYLDDVYTDGLNTYRVEVRVRIQSCRAAVVCLQYSVV